MAFGFSQFCQYAIFAALFYAGALVQDKVGDIQPQDVFIAMFSMMFGATAAG